MKKYQAYCFDLDGTVFRGAYPIQSAVEFISSLQQQGIEPYFVTNNSSKTREQLLVALNSFGIQTRIDHIYTSAVVTGKYIAEHYPAAKVYVIGEDGIRSALKAENIDVVPAEAEEADVVVMGIDRQITYDKIAKICKLVQNGAKLIGTNPDILVPREEYFFPGCGAFVQLVANASKVEPVFIGKPSPLILNYIAKEHKFTKQEMVMIGDNYHTDILCGINFGCDTVHVGTGVTALEELEGKELLPTYSIKDLSVWN